jgi:hypothetical protein
MFAIYSSCKAILPTLEPPRPHASKDPIRLKVIGVALAIHSFWLLFRGFDSETNRSVNGCYEDSLINRRVASSRMAVPYWRGLLAESRDQSLQASNRNRWPSRGEPAVLYPRSVSPFNNRARKPALPVAHSPRVCGRVILRTSP